MRMKHLFITLAATLLLAGTASAQRFQIGIRGGINFTDHAFSPVRIGTTLFSPGRSHIGYEAGFVLRLNLARHFHLYSELDYAFVNYEIDAEGTGRRTLRMKTERFQIPVGAGFQFGILRLFGGAVFRVSQAVDSTAPKLLKIKFNDNNVGLTGGLGLNVGKFFIDFRVTGFPRSHIWQTFTSEGISQRVKVRRDLIYGGSLGFFF